MCLVTKKKKRKKRKNSKRETSKVLLFCILVLCFLWEAIILYGWFDGREYAAEMAAIPAAIMATEVSFYSWKAMRENLRKYGGTEPEKKTEV